MLPVYRTPLTEEQVSVTSQQFNVNQFGPKVVSTYLTGPQSCQHRCIGIKVNTKPSLPFTMLFKKFIPWNDAKNVAPKKSRYEHSIRKFNRVVSIQDEINRRRISNVEP